MSFDPKLYMTNYRVAVDPAFGKDAAVFRFDTPSSAVGISVYRSLAEDEPEEKKPPREPTPLYSLRTKRRISLAD